MHIAQYWVAVMECNDHDELTVMALMAWQDEEISEEQSFELGDKIRARREKLTTEGNPFIVC
jgi:hypothetical protein